MAAIRWRSSLATLSVDGSGRSPRVRTSIWAGRPKFKDLRDDVGRLEIEHGVGERPPASLAQLAHVVRGRPHGLPSAPPGSRRRSRRSSSHRRRKRDCRSAPASRCCATIIWRSARGMTSRILSSTAWNMPSVASMRVPAGARRHEADLAAVDQVEGSSRPNEHEQRPAERQDQGRPRPGMKKRRVSMCGQQIDIARAHPLDSRGSKPWCRLENQPRSPGPQRRHRDCSPLVRRPIMIGVRVARLARRDASHGEHTTASPTAA